MRFLYSIVFTFSCFALMAQHQETTKPIVDLSKLKKIQKSTVTDYNTNRQGSGIPMANNPFFLQKENGPQVKSVRDNGMPTLIQGVVNKSASAAARSTQQQSFDYLEAIKSPLQITTPSEEFVQVQEQTEENGLTHIKLQQVHQGIKVYGGEVLLHTNRLGAIDLFNGQNYPSPQIASTKPSIEKEQAVTIAMGHVGSLDKVSPRDTDSHSILKHKEDQAELVIYHIDRQIDQERLVWEINLHPNKVSHWKYFVDAHSGEVLQNFKTICQLHHKINKDNWEESAEVGAEVSASNSTPFGGPESTQALDLNGNQKTISAYETGGTFFLIDATKPMFNAQRSNMPNDPVGVIWTLDARNTSPANRNFQPFQVSTTGNNWSSSLGQLGVSAQSNASQTYDYFVDTHGRNSVNDRGATIISFINVSEDDGSSMENAFWDGQYIYYGNGGSSFKELARSLDVAGHEISHGVVQNTANLEYQGESGAMNEAFADIFAVMITRDNWEIGEEVVNPNVFRGGALRSLADPHNGGSSLNTPGWQPKNVSEQFRGRQDNGGVHINSGIINHAFYLYTVSSILGEDVNANALITEKVFYRALTTYLTAQSQFRDLRIAIIRSASDLFGANSAAVAAADQAFSEVGLPSPAVTAILNTSVPTQESVPEEVEENIGQDFVVYTDANNSHLYIADGTGEVLVDPSSSVAVKSRPSVTDDGRNIVFIGVDHLMYQITIDWETGSLEEDVIEDTPIWRNVAISRDGNRIAGVTDDLLPDSEIDNLIYVFDFGLEEWQTFELFNPTFTTGVRTGNVEFADVLEFDFTSESIMYDAFNTINSGFGTDQLSYWDIGFIKVWENDNNFWEQDLENNIRKLFSGLPEDDSVGNPTFSKNSPDVIAFDYIENFNDPDPENDRFHLLGANTSTSRLDTIFTNGELNFPSYSRMDDQIIFNATTTNGSKVIAQIPLADNKIRENGDATILVSQTPGAQLGVWFSNGQRNLSTSISGSAIGLEQFTIAPNPFNNQLVLSFNTTDAEEVAIEVTNLLGQRVYLKTESVVQGENQIEMNLPALQAGTYIVNYISEKGIISRKVIKY